MPQYELKKPVSSGLGESPSHDTGQGKSPSADVPSA